MKPRDYFQHVLNYAAVVGEGVLARFLKSIKVPR